MSAANKRAGDLAMSRLIRAPRSAVWKAWTDPAQFAQWWLPQPLVAANLQLGPSETTTQKQSYVSPALTPGRTYYWKVVAKTMANKTASSATWTFSR